MNNSQPLENLKHFYIGFIIFSLIIHSIYGLVNLYGFKTGKYVEKSLTVKDFQPVGADFSGDMALISSTDDAQLIYTGDVRNIVIKCEFSQDPGEFVSFYNKSADNAFSPNKMLYAKFIDGYYVFQYPLGTKQIRIDTGIFPSIAVNFEEITINKPTTVTVWGSITNQLFYCLVVPPVLFLLTDTAKQILKKKN